MDLYEVRMAASYLRRGMTQSATFSLFARDLPANRGFLVAAGLADCLDLLERFRFCPAELDYLTSAAGLTPSDVDDLSRLRFRGTVRAVPEGTVVLADEPLLEVTAPIVQAQLVETALLNLVTYQTAIASKAARCRTAAGSKEVVDFAARRTHGPDAAMAVARASAIVGFGGTSHVNAARRYGLRAVGTMAHSYVEAFPDERAAFRAFAQDFPSAAVLLVDTYDTVAGVRAAVDVLSELRLTGQAGIRLDSGDLHALAVTARRVLDEAGLFSVRIVASGGLDEFRIARLVAGGAPIDVFGVGTKMGVSADAPSLDTAYKLVTYARRAVMKLSAGKASAPGAKQVFRSPAGDQLGLAGEPTPKDHIPLLTTVMRDGARTGTQSIADARARFEEGLAWLPESARLIDEPQPPLVRRTTRLAELTARVEASLTAV